MGACSVVVGAGPAAGTRSGDGTKLARSDPVGSAAAGAKCTVIDGVGRVLWRALPLILRPTSLRSSESGSGGDKLEVAEAGGWDTGGVGGARGAWVATYVDGGDGLGPGVRDVDGGGNGAFSIWTTSTTGGDI